MQAKDDKVGGQQTLAEGEEGVINCAVRRSIFL